MADGATAAANVARAGAEHDVIILGGGIAGLAAASRLQRAGHQVTIIERSERCGGAHKSINIGPYTFDIGSIFYDAQGELFTLADGLLEQCPQVMRRQRRIAPEGDVLHYPIEPREILRTKPWRVPLGVASMAWGRAFTRLDGSLDKISRQRLGSVFFRDTGLEAYITRFHHTAPSAIDEQFFMHRMGFIEKATRLKAMLRAGARSIFSKKTVNSHVRRPLYIRPQAGFDALFDPIRKRLEQAGVQFRFNETLQKIERDGAGFRLHTSAGTVRTRTLISTIPLAATYEALFDEPTGLISLDMTTLFVSAAKLHEHTGNVLFNFHGSGLWKRATIYSRLYPDAETDRAFMAVEVTIPDGGTHDPKAAFADLKAHWAALGIAEDLQLEGSHHMDDCYPLYAKGSDALLHKALQRVTDAAVISLGRQGRFEYLPTSTGVIRRVAEELERASILVREKAR